VAARKDATSTKSKPRAQRTTVRSHSGAGCGVPPCRARCARPFPPVRHDRRHEDEPPRRRAGQNLLASEAQAPPRGAGGR